MRIKSAGRGRRQKQSLNEYAKTKNIISRIMAQENRLKHAQQISEKVTYDLQERIKELNCLYSISKIVEN